MLHMIEAIHAAMDFVSWRKPVDLDTDRMILFVLMRGIPEDSSLKKTQKYTDDGKIYCE
jgi:hypothetical protein